MAQNFLIGLEDERLSQNSGGRPLLWAPARNRLKDQAPSSRAISVRHEFGIASTSRLSRRAINDFYFEPERGEMAPRLASM